MDLIVCEIILKPDQLTTIEFKSSRPLSRSREDTALGLTEREHPPCSSKLGLSQSLSVLRERVDSEYLPCFRPFGRQSHFSSSRETIQIT